MANAVAKLIFIPSPGIGHITSTIQIANLLLKRDERLSITVLVIKPPPGSPIANYTKQLTNKAMDRIHFVELPQAEALPKPDPEAPMTFFNEFIKFHCKYVRNLAANMMSESSTCRVVGFVIDMFCVSMMDVANEFNVPAYVYFTSNAAFLGYKLYLQTLLDTENQDIFELSNSEREIHVPSFAKLVPTKVFPALYQTQEGLDFLVYCMRKFREAKAIIVNTFLELETHAIESLSSDTSFPPVFAVGPVLNLDGIPGEVRDEDVMNWLDSQPPCSVVFLCFGSLGSFDEVQVKEIARALEQSGQRFVWSLHRPSQPGNALEEANNDYEDPRVVLPEGFLERTGGAGKVIGWAPQVAILAHQAVGGFVSHCGWNSMLESIWFGVPTATWPIYAEQQMNAFEMVVELGLAVEIKLDYKKEVFIPNCEVIIVMAEEIENGMQRLMEDSKIRAKVKEISKMSRETVAQGGSSYASIGCLIQDFMSN